MQQLLERTGSVQRYYLRIQRFYRREICKHLRLQICRAEQPASAVRNYYYDHHYYHNNNYYNDHYYIYYIYNIDDNNCSAHNYVYYYNYGQK